MARSPSATRLALALGGGGVYVAVRQEQLSDAVRELTLPLRHEDVIRQQARSKDLDPALIAAVIYEESRFRPRTSPAGAKGLMQILPGTAQFIARKSGGTDQHLVRLVVPALSARPLRRRGGVRGRRLQRRGAQRRQVGRPRGRRLQLRPGDAHRLPGDAPLRSRRHAPPRRVCAQVRARARAVGEAPRGASSCPRPRGDDRQDARAVTVGGKRGGAIPGGC